MAAKSPKRRFETGRKPELKAPSPRKKQPFLPPFPRKLKLAAAIIVIAAIISCIAFVGIGELREKRALDKKLLGFEEAISETNVQITKGAIEEAVASGTRPVLKEQALSGEGDYVCSLTTDKGIIILKKRGSLMREEIVRDGYNLSVLFIDNKLYIYQPQYNVWAMFPYDENIAISNDKNMHSAFSLSELIAIDEKDYLCIKTGLPQDEFSLGDIRIVDAPKFLAAQGFLR